MVGRVISEVVGSSLNGQEAVVETTVIIAVSLIVSFIANQVVYTARIKHCPQSSAAIIVGVLVAIYLYLRFGFAPTDLLDVRQKDDGPFSLFLFNPDFFYFFLLPPIVLDAGFSLDRPNFLRNIGMIIWLAVGGTIIAATTLALGLYVVARSVNMEGSNFELFGYCWLYGILLSAVDPVATLSILGSSRFTTDERLFALVFGESILNDVVAIALYRTAERMFIMKSPLDPQNSSLVITFHAAMSISKTFLYVTIASCLVGAFTGVLAFAAFRLSAGIRKFPEYELGILLLLAYFSFAFAEMIKGSGILALFVTGSLLGHYNVRNLSLTSQRVSTLLFKVVAVLSESFIYILFGVVGAGSIRQLTKFNWPLIGMTMILILLGRAIVIFPSSKILNMLTVRKIWQRKTTLSQQIRAHITLHLLLRKQLTTAAWTPLARSIANPSPIGQCTTRTIPATQLVVPGDESESFYSRRSVANIVDHIYCPLDKQRSCLLKLQSNESCLQHSTPAVAGRALCNIFSTPNADQGGFDTVEEGDNEGTPVMSSESPTPPDLLVGEDGSHEAYVGVESVLRPTGAGDVHKSVAFHPAPGQKMVEYLDDLRKYHEDLIKNEEENQEATLGFPAQFILWLSGLRGAIAFVLALSLPIIPTPTSQKNVHMLMTSTLATAILTTVVFGGSIEYFALKLGLIVAVNESQTQQQQQLSPRTTQDPSNNDTLIRTPLLQVHPPE